MASSLGQASPGDTVSFSFEAGASGLASLSTQRDQLAENDAILAQARLPSATPMSFSCDLEVIEHRTTRVPRPQGNGFVERLHRALPDQRFRIKGRQNGTSSLLRCRKYWTST